MAVELLLCNYLNTSTIRQREGLVSGCPAHLPGWFTLEDPATADDARAVPIGWAVFL
jgi:hypothetical protein